MNCEIATPLDSGIEQGLMRESTTLFLEDLIDDSLFQEGNGVLKEQGRCTNGYGFILFLAEGKCIFVEMLMIECATFVRKIAGFQENIGIQGCVLWIRRACQRFYASVYIAHTWLSSMIYILVKSN